jgi:hypothetical protein
MQGCNPCIHTPQYSIAVATAIAFRFEFVNL